MTWKKAASLAFLCSIALTLAFILVSLNQKADRLSSILLSSKQKDIVSKEKELAAKQETLAAAKHKLTELDNAQNQSINLHYKLTRSREYLDFVHPTLRRGIQEDFSKLFSKLQLTPEKLEQLKRLLVEQSEWRLLANNIADENGVQLTKKQLDAITRNAGDNTENRIRELLGEENYAQYTRHKDTQSRYKYTLLDISRDLQDAGIPCSAGQLDALFESFADAQESTAKTAGTKETLQASVLQRTTAFLSEKQRSVLTRFFEDQNQAALIRSRIKVP